MARIGLTTIAPIKSSDIVTITINNKEVQVKTYLSMEDKAALLADILGDVLDSNGVVSVIREKLYTDLYIVKYYTNINFTETMLNQASKTYDILELNDIFSQIFSAIPQKELEMVRNLSHNTLQILMQYRLSALGLMEAARSGQMNDLADVAEINNVLEQLTTNSTLKDILTKMG